MGKIKDIKNKRFGRIFVLSRIENRNGFWLCLCSCGKKKELNGCNLRRGSTKSCGCLAKELSSQRAKTKLIDISGRKYGMLTAIKLSRINKYEHYWIFKCDCGNEKEILKRSIVYKSSDVRSCSCLLKESSRKRFTGKNNPNWRGGITPLNEAVRTCILYKQWRRKVLERDRFECQHCGQKSKNLEVDHIKPFSIIMIENNIQTFEQAISCLAFWLVENGRTLCRECHKKTDTYTYKMNKLLKDYV